MVRSRRGDRIGRSAAASLAASLLFGPMNAQGAAPAPDFSGVWGRTSVDYEPPPSGPGPVMNQTRTFYMRVGDDTNPILKPEAAEKVRRAAAISRTGVNFATPSNQCTPWSPPYAWRALLMQMVQQKDQITIMYVGDQQIRQVRLNQPHSTRVTPSYMGDSIGHYEGDTLVIDTVGTKTDRPFAMIDVYGTPYTGALHVVERYRLIDYEAAQEGLKRDAKENRLVPGDIDPNYRGKFLQVQFTVEDEGVFTTPWTATITYRPAPAPWQEIVCAENTHEYYYNKDSEVPTANRPDF